jgi:GNAT superfamily N-acetyltransferase
MQSTLKRQANSFDLHAELTSSIGSTAWPPEPASFERYKGIVPIVVERREQLEVVMGAFENIPFTDICTRVSVRLAVTADVLALLCTQYRHYVEAAFPLRGIADPALAQCWWVYIGRNAATRTVPATVELRQRAQIATVNTEPTMSKKVLPEGYSLVQLDMQKRADRRLRSMLHDLYVPFGWDARQLQHMLANANLLLFAVGERTSGLLVSTVQIEVGTITLQWRDRHLEVVLAEMTEAATLPAYRGRGLYRALADAAMHHLASSTVARRPCIVYGEVNCDAPAALHTAAGQGYVHAYQTAQALSIDHAWRLQQHAPIGWCGQRPGSYPYNNLSPALMTNAGLAKFQGMPYTHSPAETWPRSLTPWQRHLRMCGER